MQLLAENVYASTFSMRSAEGMTPAKMFPSIFEDDDEDIEPDISEEEVLELQNLMAEINAQNEESSD